MFPKGLTHGFGWKLAIFLSFFLGNIGHENVFYDSLEQKNGFLGDKNKKFKKSKNKRFSKGVNSSFGQKFAIFPYFFLGNIGQGNMFYVF